MSGDWRQTPPIVPSATPADIVDAAFISSDLWASVTSMRMPISQRDKTDAAYWSLVRRSGEGAIPPQTFLDGEHLMPRSNGLWNIILTTPDYLLRFISVLVVHTYVRSDNNVKEVETRKIPDFLPTRVVDFVFPGIAL